MQYKSKAIRVKEIVLKDIWSGVFDRSGYLPGEDVMAGRYGVSRMTLRRIFAELVADGVLEKIPNCGTRISPWIDLPGNPAEKSAQKRRIAAVMAAFPDLFTIELTRGIREFADEKDVSFVLLQSPRNLRELDESISRMGTEEFDGFLLLDDLYGNLKSEDILKKFNRPVVYVDTVPVDSAIPYVGADHFAGAYRATSCLLSRLGNFNCFFFSESLNTVSVEMRRDGFCQAMRAFGLPEPPEQNVVLFSPKLEKQFTVSEKEKYNYHTALQLLEKAKKPCGIFAQNDYLARSVAMAAKSLGLTLGKDVLLIGFDDLPLAETLQLSSIRTDRVRIGREAAEALLRMIETKENFHFNKIVPVELVERASTGN